MREAEATRADLSVSRIRRLAPADVAAIQEMMEASPEAAAWSPGDLLQLAHTSGDVWVADHQGAAIGFLAARLVGVEGEILNIAVSPTYRRRGVARELLRAVLGYAKRLGCTRVYLEVRTSNTPALALYAQYGFTEYGRRRLYYRDPKEDAVLLVWSLSSESAQDPK